MSSGPYSLMISGGGTGGHIFPALAIAQEFHRRHPEANIRFVGAVGRMEMEKIPEAGYPIDGLWISGLQRKLSLKNLTLPLKILTSFAKAYRLLQKHRPQAVVGTGGYASGVLLYVAQKMGIPTLIQEQNSFPGITNRKLAPGARVICAAYPETARYFPKNKLVITGNPLRSGLLNSREKRAEAKMALGSGQKPTLLVLGGSLGARSINRAVDRFASTWVEKGIHVIWQCGKLYYDELRPRWEGKAGVDLRPFIANMGEVYAAADLVMSRAGAGTLSELAALGLPAVLVPSPNVAEDHQTHNARSLASEGGAVVVPETEMDRLLTLVPEILADPQQLAAMEKGMLARALPNATADIVNELEKLL